MFQRGTMLLGTAFGAFAGNLLGELSSDPWNILVKALSDVGAIAILAWYLYYDVCHRQPKQDARLDAKDQLLRDFIQNCPCAKPPEKDDHK